jgi:hypothetical protein
MKRYIYPEEYKTAFLKLPLSKSQRAMLIAHYRAPGQLITFGELAAAAGYQSAKAVNLQYGLIAVGVCDALSIEEDKRPWPRIEVLAVYEHAQGEMRFWELRMRIEVAGALENLRWV